MATVSRQTSLGRWRMASIADAHSETVAYGVGGAGVEASMATGGMRSGASGDASSTGGKGAERRLLVRPGCWLSWLLVVVILVCGGRGRAAGLR